MLGTICELLHNVLSTRGGHSAHQPKTEDYIWPIADRRASWRAPCTLRVSPASRAPEQLAEAMPMFHDCAPRHSLLTSGLQAACWLDSTALPASSMASAHPGAARTTSFYSSSSRPQGEHTLMIPAGTAQDHCAPAFVSHILPCWMMPFFPLKPWTCGYCSDAERCGATLHPLRSKCQGLHSISCPQRSTTLADNCPVRQLCRCIAAAPAAFAGLAGKHVYRPSFALQSAIRCAPACFLPASADRA